MEEHIIFIGLEFIGSTENGRADGHTHIYRVYAFCICIIYVCALMRHLSGRLNSAE